MTKKKDDPAFDGSPDDVDPEQAARIAKLREQIQDAAEGEAFFGADASIDPDLDEDFLEYILRFEEGNTTAPMDHLVNAGFELVPSAELDDEALAQKLRELILAMAVRNMFVHSTDHLSDRELYVFLAEEALTQETFVGPPEPEPGCHFIIDVLGGCSEQDIDRSFRYYRHDDDDRRDWMEQFPEYEMPPKEKPPYDRDRFLPKPNYEKSTIWGQDDDDFVM